MGVRVGRFCVAGGSGGGGAGGFERVFSVPVGRKGMADDSYQHGRRLWDAARLVPMRSVRVRVPRLERMWAVLAEKHIVPNE